MVFSKSHGMLPRLTTPTKGGIYHCVQFCDCYVLFSLPLNIALFILLLHNKWYQRRLFELSEILHVRQSSYRIEVWRFNMSIGRMKFMCHDKFIKGAFFFLQRTLHYVSGGYFTLVQ
jgi:hypothetical protein